jgi:hypothetical protein
MEFYTIPQTFFTYFNNEDRESFFIGLCFLLKLFYYTDKWGNFDHELFKTHCKGIPQHIELFGEESDECRKRFFTENVQFNAWNTLPRTHHYSRLNPVYVCAKKMRALVDVSGNVANNRIFVTNIDTTSSINSTPNVNKETLRLIWVILGSFVANFSVLLLLGPDFGYLIAIFLMSSYFYQEIDSKSPNPGRTAFHNSF